MSAVAGVGGRAWRTRWWSLRVDSRTLVTNGVLVALLAGLAIWSLSAGDFPLPIGKVIAVLTGQGEKADAFIVLGLRMPRLLTGLCTGLALGVSGAIFQSLARNPLASPDVIGFDAGAALGAVAMVILAGASGTLVATGAIGAGLLTAAVVFGLSWHKGGVAPVRLVLVGIGVGFFAYAGVEFLLTRGDIFEASAAQAWLTGSLNARVWAQVWTVGAGVALLLPLALLLEQSLDRLELGDEMAAALGIRVAPARVAIGLVGVLLAALAVASAGPLPFVAFVAGPLTRRMTGRATASLVSAGIVGAVVVTAGDLGGRLVFAPTQLPVGVFTAVFGAPYLLWLLATQMRKGTM